MTRPRRWWILAAIAVTPALGCGHHASSPSEPVVPPPDSLAIDSISPPAGTTLAPGSTVVFGAVLSYAAHEDIGGGIAAQMQDQNGLLATMFPATAVPQGAGTLALVSQFHIPSSGAIRVDIVYTLYATPGVTTQIVAATKASYPVGR